ncbi:hypothetical protein [Kordiimonas sediminis]|nr:hypothetical protein [Kordiimonas sediminis]
MTTNVKSYMEGIANQRTLYREGMALCDQLDNLLGRAAEGRSRIQTSLQTADGIYTAQDLVNADLLIGEVRTRLLGVSSGIDTLMGS